jgi:hypothetical protein
MSDDDDWRSMLHRDLVESREGKRAAKVAARGERALYSTYEWQARRDDQLERFPYCLGCQACGRGQVIATICDHVLPRSGRPDEPFMAAECQSICASCHVLKRRLERRFLDGQLKRDDLRMNSKAAIAANQGSQRGCTVDGMPTDETYIWRQTLNKRKQTP